MEYTSQLLVEFLKKLIEFDIEYKSAVDKTEQDIVAREEEEENEWNNVIIRTNTQISDFLNNMNTLLNECKNEIASISSCDIDTKKQTYLRLQKCKQTLSLIESVEKSITNREEYDKIGKEHSSSITMSLDEVISANDQFINLAYEINNAIKDDIKKEITSKCAELYSMCRHAEQILNSEIVNLRSSIVENLDTIHNSFAEVSMEANKKIAIEWDTVFSNLDTMTKEFASQRVKSKNETCKVISSSENLCLNHIQTLIDNFCLQFPPEQFANEYARIHFLEPSFEHYKCAKEMPKNIYISTIEYDLTSLGLCDHTKEFLGKYYHFMYRNNKLLIPYCTQFNSEFNYIFEFDSVLKSKVAKDACDMGMRLFMMLPPGKVNFTFVDPISLGESFSMFTRLVDADDRTSEIINGKIWSDPADIEDKLKIMTNHISNVTQRCLQGKYDTIFEYNQVADQNAEAYQIIMLMDYPAGLSDQSLKFLEQIVTSGPKCGVFTVIYKNKSQYDKLSQNSTHLSINIETRSQEFNYSPNAKEIFFSYKSFKNQKLIWNGIRMPNSQQMDDIISTLKKGIKNADKVVIGLEKIGNAEITNSTKDGIRIPIGIHGANEIQYLTLGVGGSHHALIAGLTRSGKSSLLHTIIMRALAQYESPDELSIYLVDFKRGVEFKTYADYILPMFKVIAIETEREFGYNILEALEREQKIRADLFKRNHVDKIQEYRELPNYDKMIKMPRVLLVMDEFHELFSNTNDEIGKKASIIMERIVRQGAAFGIHLILSSQSYSNITGLDKAVFDQMAVRIVLKCSKADANMLLDGGSTEIDQISIDDPGRAVYNSEAGNKEYNSHFRVAYIEPEKHREMLQEISDTTKRFADPQQPTRILLSNIEDNNYSIFKQFATLNSSIYKTPGRLYIGEPLSVSNSMAIDFSRSEYSNLLMIGEDTEKARSMFVFAILSLCINYKIDHQLAPNKPFIYLFNCKPLDDSYFKDTPKLLAEFLPEYIQYVRCGDTNEIQTVVSKMYENVTNGASEIETDNYFFVFGYQRAEELKSEIQLSQSEDIDSLFNIMPTSNISRMSLKDMFRTIVKNGAQKGIHTILWQDSFNALYQDDKDIMSYFSMKIAFDMSPEEYSRFVSANDVSLMSENNAIYYNRARDNQKFRPYQSPDEDWLKNISDKLK